MTAGTGNSILKRGPFRAAFRFFLLSAVLAAFFISPARAAAQTELGSEDDLTVLGTDGTVPDPDVEIKGFSIFGSTSLITHISTAPGNVVINGALEVSSDVYVIGFASATKYYGDGSSLTGLSGLADNLGNHTATQQLNMGNYAVWSSSDITAARYQINGSTVLAVLPGFGSIAVGPGAGRTNTGNYNTFVGNSAGKGNNTGTANVYVNASDGNGSTGGSYNVAIGVNAAYNASADYGVSIGHDAGNVNTGTQNVFVGDTAGNDNTSGTGQVFIGANAGQFTNTGGKNTFVGYGAAGLGNTTGTNNTALGYQAFSESETGSNNAVFGYFAGKGVNANSFSNTTIMGASAGYSLTTGNDNVFLGYQAGYDTTVGTRNIVVGYDQRASAPAASNELNIGGVLYGKLDAKTVGISTRSPQAALDVVSTGTTNAEMAQIWRDGSGVVVGSMSATGVFKAVKILGDISGASGLPSGDNLGNHTATQNLNLASWDIVSVSSVNFKGNVFLTSATAANYGGLYVSSHVYFAANSNIFNVSTIAAAGDITAKRYQINGSPVLAVLAGNRSLGVGVGAGAANNADDNTFLGYSAGGATATGIGNTAAGASALMSSASGNYNTASGYYALRNTTTSRNTATGAFALQTNTDGYYNTAYGYSALNNNLHGIDNTAIGYQSLYTNTGSNNTGLGDSTLYSNLSGSNNTAAGYYAMYNNAGGGSANVAIGNSAGYNPTGTNTVYFSSVTLVGSYAGYNLSTGNDNIFVGWRAGYNVDTGTGNIIVGYNQQTPASGTNNFLNIGGLVYGDLSAKTIGVNKATGQQAALDVVSTGTTNAEMAQIWRDGSGVIVASMSATGVLMANRLIGTVASGDNLGNHTATQNLNMAAKDIVSVSTISVSSITTAAAGVTFSTNVYFMKGNIGMGTANPQEKATIYGDGSHILFNSATANPLALMGISFGENAGPPPYSMSLSYDGSATGNSNRLIIRDESNNLDRVTFQLGGNVGIGVSSPQTSLNIVRSADTLAPLRVQSAVNTGYSGVHFADNGGTVVGHMGYANPSAANFPDQFYFGSIAAKKLNLTTSDVVRMTVDAAGNVGISSTSPSFRLVVSSGAGESGNLLVISTGASNVIRMTGAGEIYANKFYGDISGASGLPAGDNLGNHTATNRLEMSNKAIDNVSSMTVTGAGVTGSDPLFKVAGSTLTVLNNGNVGVGVAAPTNKFEVQANATAFQVNPQAGYVSLMVNGVEVARLKQ